MQKRIIFLTVGVLLIFSVGFINISLAQSTAVNNNLNLQTVDCSKYSSSQEVLLCNYFNILVTLITNYLKILTSNNQTLPPISNQLTTPPQTTPVPLPITPTSTLTVPVKLLDKTIYGSNGDASISLYIQGYQSNKQVNRWELVYSCPKGVILDNRKNTSDKFLCDGNDTYKSSLIYYSANIYDVTTDNLILTAGAQNKNSYPAQISFNLFAYDANNRLLGSDSKVINLGAYNVATSTQPSTSMIYFVNPDSMGVKGGLDIQPGTYYNVNWKSSGVKDINLYLCNLENACKFIAKTSSSGSYSWYVDPNHPYFPGSNLRLKLEDASNPNVYAYSGYFSVGVTSIPMITVKLLDKTNYGSNGDAFVNLYIQGNQSNKQVNRWSLNYFCPKGVTLDTGKELLCDGNDSFKSALNFYSYNIYDVTTDNPILRAGAQNKNPYPAQISFNLFAYDANNRLLGSDSKVINLGAYNPNPRLSINKTNFYPNDTWELYLTQAPANQPVTICAIDNKGVQSCTPAKNLGLKEATDVFGNWSASGSWAKTITAEQIQNILGNWTEWVQVGDKTSNKVNFTLTNPSNSYLNTINQLANIVTSLNSLINQIGSLR
jgi:hypothetical protein